MANLLVKDGAGANKYLSATGVGTDPDPHVMQQAVTVAGVATAANQATEVAALAAIQTAVQLLDNAVAGSELQVDVLTLPALSAGSANIGDVDVLTLPALPAGTNNIGDVDVLTIAAGETHIGKVSTPDEVFDLTLTLDTVAYADGDLLADTQSIASVARVNAGVVILESITIIDEDDQKQPLTLIFLDANNTLGTENAAPSVSDANARNILGFVRVTAGDYIDLGGVAIACVRGVALQMKMAAASATIYVGAVINGVGTYTASGLKLKLAFLRS